MVSENVDFEGEQVEYVGAPDLARNDHDFAVGGGAGAAEAGVPGVGEENVVGLRVVDQASLLKLEFVVHELVIAGIGCNDSIVGVVVIGLYPVVLGVCARDLS